MGRDGYYWSVDDCRWVQCAPLVAPEQATSPEDAVAAEADTA
jgi:hypothetical protein